MIFLFCLDQSLNIFILLKIVALSFIYDLPTIKNNKLLLLILFTNILLLLVKLNYILNLKWAYSSENNV